MDNEVNDRIYIDLLQNNIKEFQSRIEFLERMFGYKFYTYEQVDKEIKYRQNQIKQLKESIRLIQKTKLNIN
tara:strand:- start:380 stop:595 length:216 start_codon:yes stop_codon:yes gene_type:complete